MTDNLKDKHRRRNLMRNWNPITDSDLEPYGPWELYIDWGKDDEDEEEV